MKLLLLQPPIQDFYQTDIRLQPIGLCYLKAALGQHLPEIQVVVRDYHQGWGRRTIAVPPELGYLRDFWSCADRSPFSTFYHYYHFGAPFERIVAEVEREAPDLVGISALFSPYFREALRCAREIRQRLGLPILMGGSHVSADPMSVLSHDCVDFVIRGEGERPLVELIRTLRQGGDLNGVPNLGHKRSGRPVLNPVGDNFALDALAFPDLSDLETHRYLFKGRPLSFVITSRSCPHRCTFCSVHSTFGKTYRRRSVESVVQEIRTRHDEGYRVFDFEDDNLTFYIPEMKELCRQLISAFPDRDVQFLAMNGISYLSLDRELLELMREAGFSHLNLALVTSDITVRETTKRPHTSARYLQVVRDAHQLGFQIVSYQILGLPQESLDSMIQTLTFSAPLPVLLGASLFYLTPNSPIAREFPPHSETDVFKSRLTAMAVETPHFRREDLYTLFITTRILNFLKGIECGGDSISLPEALAWARSRAGRQRLGAQLLERLLEGEMLWASTTKGEVPLRRFRPDLFRQVWSSLESIGTQSGGSIRLKDV